MSSRRDATPVELCLNKVKERQQQLDELPLTDHYISTQQCLQELRNGSKTFLEVTQKVEEIKKSRGHTHNKEFDNLETELLLTEDLNQQKKRCLETVLFVSEIENLLQNVESDIEARALYLSQRPLVFDSVYRGEDVPAQSKIHKDCVSAIRKSWSWIQTVNECLGIHIENAANYHQFYHDVCHLEEDMLSFLLWMDSSTVRAQVKTQDPDVMLKHFRLIIKQLLDYQGQLDLLTERSRDIHPVHYRKELPEWPLKARALVQYQHKHIKTLDGIESEVPAIVLVIPPADPSCFQQIDKLREQIKVNSSIAVKRLRSHLIQFLSSSISQTQSKDLEGLSAQQKYELMKMVNEAADILKGADSEFLQLNNLFISFRKLISHIKPGDAGVINSTIQRWKKTGALVRMFVELGIYSRHYSEELSSQRKEEMFMVKDLGSNYTYTSKAYFERVVPTYEIDIITKETKMTAFKSDLYIFERNRDETLASHTIKKTKADSVQAAVGEDVVDGLPDVSFQSTLKNFAISGIVDPRTKQRLTISQALAKGVLNTDFGTYNNLEKGEIIPIIEAIARGYISVDYENHEQALNELETKVYTVSGVVNPKTGEIVSAKESINSGLFNLKTGKFTNPVTGEELSLCDAVRAGYILADSALQDEDNPLFSTSTSIVLEDAKYTVLAVTNLSTGQDVSLSQAIKDGIIDPIHGIYKNNWTGETMPIEEAFKRGYIKGKLFDPLQDKEDENVLCYQQLQVKKQILKAGQLVGGNLQSSDPNELLLNKLHEIENTANIMIQNPKTGKPISLEDSVLSGCINLADGSFETQNGEIISITEACALGLIEGQTLKEILRVYQQLSLANLVSSGQFDPYTGLVTDLKSGQTCTLQAAVESRVIDPTCTFFYDLAQNRVLSLSEAFDTGRLNKLSGEVIHPSTGEKLSVEQAELKKQINCDINPDEIVERLESLALLRRCMDTHQPAIRVPNVQHLVSVEEAVTMGILQVPKAAYVEEETVGQVQLGLAVQMERMDSQVALTILAALDKHSLEQEIGQGHFNPTTGMYMNPKTQKQFTIDEAHKSGLWNPYCVFLVDTETDSVTSLGYLADKGKYDPVSCHYLSDTMDASMTINEAIAKGLILPYIEPEKYVDTSCALKDLIDSGKVNPRTTDFMAANDLRLSLRDALANGFLTMGSKVKIDSETGAVVLASNEIVVQSLIQVKEQSDWLSDIANVLASQGLPSEKLDTLKRQTEDCLGLKEEISRNEPELRNVISQAEQIMQENVKTQDNQKVKDEVAQQFQKLKSSTTDLKVRFDMVNTETDNRSPKLSQMGRNLEELYYQMEELDQWLDSAIEKTQDFQLPSVEIDIQYTSMKELLEELKEREEDLSSIVKSADAFKENIQDVDKDVESFRKRLDILPTLREAGDAGVLDDELESIEAKFKDISKECAKQMERIGTLAKLSKIVNEHKERLSQAYPVIQENLNKLIEDEDFGLDPHRAAIDRDNLRNIKSDLIGQERKLKDLPAAGDRLVSGLLDSERNEEAEEVQAMLEFLREEHDRLQEDISEQEQQLDAAAAEQHNVLGRLEGIEMSLRECEEQVASQRDISLDKEKLSQQIQEQRLVNAKIASNRSLLERLCLDVEGNNEAEQKLKNLMELAEALESRAEERTQELEELLTNIVEYESKAVDLDSWLSESIKTLKPKSGAPKPTKTKVEGLYEGKAEKDGEMETLRQMCGHLSEANGVKDKYALKELLADVETKWNDLTELLVQQVSLEALSEIDGMLKYLDKAENEINTAESISIDPETLSIQLREHKIFDTDLKGKRNAVKDIIDKCTHMLRETANSQSDEIKFRLDTITQQADLVCQLSADRLHQLEAALPLATHYGENQTEVCAWLDEMEAELVAQCEPGLNLEQVKKQHDNLKANQQIIEDRKLFIDDLNSTGLELMDICAEQDAVDIQNRLLEGLKSKAHTKSRDLTDAKRKLTQEAGDTLDHLKDELDGLHQTVTNADPILSSPEKLRNEIDENKAVLEDLEHQKQALAKAEDVAKNPKAYGVEDLTDAEELQHKYKEICDMSKDIRLMAEARDKNLTTALKLSERFYDMSVDVMSGLRDPLEYTAV